MRAVPMLVAPGPLFGRSVLGAASVWMGVASTVVVVVVQERNGLDH